MSARGKMTSANGPVDLVRRFRGLRAVALGDAILDTYLQGTAERLCVEGPVPIVRKQEEWRLPGGAANTAANLRALGAQVTYIGVVGPDGVGREIRAALAARGVDVHALIEDQAIVTQSKLRILADGQYIVRFDQGTTCPPTAASRRKLLATLDVAMADCDVVAVSDYCYGALSEALMRYVRAQCARRDIPLIVDTKQLGRYGRLSGAVITPNLHEARAFIAAHGGLARAHARGESDEHKRVSEGRDLAAALVSLLDARLAAVTLASDGVALASGAGESWHVPAHPVARPNDVGAGDSFTAALALSLAAGGAPDLAASVGVDAASIAVTKRFTAQVERRELLQLVSLRERARDGYSQTQATSAAARRRALARTRAMLDLERAAGRVIVFTNGVFDMLHAGHLEFLRRAKELGDTLVVGVNSDESARRFAAGRAPLRSARDRLALLAALEPVDYALLFDDAHPAQLIRALRPDIHVKGGDYADEALPEAEAAREVGARIVITPLAGASDPAREGRHADVS